MKAGKAPKAPDPGQMAQQQFGNNVNSSWASSLMNNPNVSTPYGSSIFQQTGMQNINGVDVPQFSQNISLSPEQRQLYDQQMAMGSTQNQLAMDQMASAQGRLGAITPGQMQGSVNLPELQRYGGASPLMTSFQNAGPIQTDFGNNYGQVQTSLGSNDFEGSRKSVEDAIYSRLNPQLDADRSALESRLANQGIMPGSEAYRESIALNDRARTDARMQAVLAGGSEQSRLGNLANMYGQFANNAQGQQFGQAGQLAGFNNAAQGQQFGQNMGMADFANNATQQNNQNNLQGLQYNNELANQGFNQHLAAGNFANSATQQDFQNQMAAQNQLINSMGALSQGGQVQMPQFAGFQGQQISPVDSASLQQQAYQNQLGAYNQRQSQNNAMMGGLFGLGGSLLAAPMTGGGSLAGGLMGGLMGGMR